MTLAELIPSYGQHKADYNALEKVCDIENAEIKSQILKSGQMKHEVDGWKASVSVRKDEKFNEDKLIKLLTTDTRFIEVGADIVKQKPYVDFDALEEAIYRGDIDKDMLLELDKVKESKEVVTLRISKVKEKK